ALVELEPCLARHPALDRVHEPLELDSLRCEPEAVVDHGGVPAGEGVAQREHLAVEDDGLDGPPRLVHDGSTRRLVHAPALDAHEAVLDDVDPTHAMPSGHLVEPGEDLDRLHLDTVDGNGVPGLEPND